MLPASDPGALRAFLGHPSRPAGTLSYHELQGFLFTVVNAPELIPMSEWMLIIFAGEDVDYASVEETEAAIGQIMTLSNTINAAVLEPPTLLPADCYPGARAQVAATSSSPSRSRAEIHRAGCTRLSTDSSYPTGEW